MSEASALWYARVEKAIQELHETLEHHQRGLTARASLRAELQLASRKRQAANDDTATPNFGQGKAA